MFEPISGESIDKLVRQHGFGYRERQVLIDFVKLELRDRTIIPDYVKYLAANARLRTQKVAGTIEEEADAFAAIARVQFIAKKSGSYKPHPQNNHTRVKAMAGQIKSRPEGLASGGKIYAGNSKILWNRYQNVLQTKGT